MTPDLLLPVMFIVIMYVILGCVDDALTLIAIAALFLPISLMFAQIVNSGGYTTLFGATLISGTAANSMLIFAMFMIPIYAITKIFYIKHSSGGNNE